MGRLGMNSATLSKTAFLFRLSTTSGNSLVSFMSITSSTTTPLACLAFLNNLLDDYHPRDFAVRLWDGDRAGKPRRDRDRVILLCSPIPALATQFLPPRILTLCEAYINGDFDIEGDIEAFWRLAQYLFVSGEARAKVERKNLEQQLAEFPAQGSPRGERLLPELHGPAHSPDREKQAVPPQYGTSNDFYALWLDHRMVYTCAYFKTSVQDLDSAQEQKLDYICRKLRLQPGERLLDIGCGWGGLVMHAGQRYGVQAVGITITPEQARLWATARNSAPWGWRNFARFGWATIEKCPRSMPMTG